jgi:hypothetical protein
VREGSARSITLASRSISLAFGRMSLALRSTVQLMVLSMHGSKDGDKSLGSPETTRRNHDRREA